MSNSYYAFIFARGGSKGLPGKNTRHLDGKPLIAWSIEQAKAVPRISRIVVSTDSPEIAEIASNAGAEVPFMRPAELAQDTSSEWLAWQHALTYFRDQGTLPSAMLSLPCTAPLRHTEDINNCLDQYETDLFDVVVTMTQAHRNPWFNMLKARADGPGYEWVNKPAQPIYRRQDAPIVYDMTTVAYVANSEFVLSRNGLFEGNMGAVEVPIERAIDIDTLFDFEFAEFLLSRRGNQS